MAVQHERHAALVSLGIDVAVHHRAGPGVFEILLLVDSEILRPGWGASGRQEADQR